MTRGAPRVPLVVFPQDGEVLRLAPLDAAARQALDAARDALLSLRVALDGVTGRGEELDHALETAVAGLRRLSGALAAELPLLEAEQTIPSVPVHSYFGVRAAPLTPLHHAAQVAAILFRSLADARRALVDLNDLSAEVQAMLQMLQRLAPANGRPGDRARRAPADEPGVAAYEPDGDALERWILVHHLYFLLNLYAAAAVRAAVRALADGAPESAPALLDEATVYVRGLTAAMMHSGDLPAAHYQAVVRPTMQPPFQPLPLTGAMQPEHASYRAAIEELLAAVPASFLALVRHDRALALARDSLLSADLVDIERHTVVAGMLVGDDHSLVQHEQAPDNAVSILRRMRHARAARYCPLMRFGDRWIESERMTG